MATERQNIDPARYLDKEGIQVDARRLDRALTEVPGRLKEELLDAFDHIRKGFFKALYVNTGLKDRRFIATKKVGIGRHIKVYRNPNKGDTLDMEMGIFTRSKIAAMLEKGGTITAKSGLMAIPLPPALGPTGRLSQEMSDFHDYRRSFSKGAANGMSMRGKGTTFFMLAKGGKMFLMRKEGEKVEPYFVLKNRIKIQPRLRMVDTWNRMEGYRIEVLNKNIGRALAAVGLADDSGLK